DALAAALHRIQVRQLVPEAVVDGDGLDVDGLAASLRPEVVQLWYQMALAGRRDLPLAPGPRAGFEMSLLRMLAFRPVEGAGQGAGTSGGGSAGRGSPRDAATAAAAAARAALADELPPRAEPSRRSAPASAAPEPAPRPEPAPPP